MVRKKYNQGQIFFKVIFKTISFLFIKKVRSRLSQYNYTRTLSSNFFPVCFLPITPNKNISNTGNANTNTNAKTYTPINSYKPSGKLLYSQDLLNRIEDKFT